MSFIAPNMSKVVGPTVAAKLIGKCHSLHQGSGGQPDTCKCPSIAPSMSKGSGAHSCLHFNVSEDPNLILEARSYS